MDATATYSNGSSATSDASPVMVTLKPGIPVHLVWDDVSAVPTVPMTKKTKKSVNLSFKMKEGATAEERGVCNITFANLEGYTPPAAEVEMGTDGVIVELNDALKRV
mmetsp:Transcript_78834/g.156747  ORF Transcript_78834/g.156747 Transcript_78834/m.156747 type:complete len:107 (-) Transcript_78834:124-444(-)|eukprot:CAMPEP_0174703538 /NCGR_PEP_ID=MMETSP1094-20130205/7448_1 /TAXON_ID=156173 /ORGANISM="Chrysochromulina brevifilum, Strain UTEX LB 985" /LENGTH=106 /DNA_ID=CAMNT_0015901473 /DNA_START=200 /DNA_END=520 /DNA_ORIENTATION=+